MVFNERFEQFLGMKRISQKDFAKRTGFPTYSLSKIITGTTKTPKIDLIIVLMQYFPELNLRWLLLEEGEMFIDKTPISSTVFKNELDNLRKENSKLKDKIIALLEKS